jgi:hypothetical protein
MLGSGKREGLCTKNPERGFAQTTDFASRLTSARTAVEGLTFWARQISRTEGTLSPGASTPFAISDSRWDSTRS